jgi:formylglycine-generating enzyme required for sulfatase activity
MLTLLLVVALVSTGTSRSEQLRPAGDPHSGHPAAGVAAAGGFFDPVSGVRFITIRGGSYQMGDNFNEGDLDEQPAHEVTVSDFSLAVTPVTKGEFRNFVAATGYKTDAEKEDGCYLEHDGAWSHVPATSWRNPGFRQNDKHPVVCVSWNDATAYAGWLSRPRGRHYRLPTEAEWEYAARSGGKKERFAGFSEPEKLGRYANFCDRNCTAEWRSADQNDGFRNTAPVGSYLPNGLGLHDMTGNVIQWVADYYDVRYYRDSATGKKSLLEKYFGANARIQKATFNPKGPASGLYRALKGSSWNAAPLDSRVSQRLRNKPEYRRSYVGFRLAASAP